MPETSLKAFTESWEATKRGEVSAGTLTFYQNTKKRLLAHLGDKADADINFITKADIARLTWANVDDAHGSLHLTTRQTGARITIPLSADMRAFLKENPAPPQVRPEAAPLFPKAHRIVQGSGKVSTLSLQFTNILASVGLREPVTHKSTGKGRAAERDVAGVSFHSLRHSAVSLLNAAGVPDAIVMALVGHETLAMSSHCTHVGKESLESAVASLPSFGPAPEGVTPASNDEDAGVNENAATLKPA